jgi:hypothetical protein
MKDSIFEAACPCCGAKLEIDREAGIILTHQEPARKSKPTDLRKAVQDLDKEAALRDERFQKEMEAQRGHEDELDKKFASLLKKEEGKTPTKPDWRDIDFD